MTRPETPAEHITHRDRFAPFVVLLMSLAIIGGCLLAFGPALDANFLNWDDDRNFLTNDAYRGLGAANIAWAWRTYHLGVWQPLSWMLLGAEHAMAGIDAFGRPRPSVYHVTSVLLHTANALMVFALCTVLLRATLRERAAENRRACLWSAGAAALLFAVHPLRTEAVVWISGQPYLPAIFFCLLAVVIYVRSGQHRADGSPSTIALVSVFVCFAIAVLFKAVAVTLPAVLIICDVYPLRRWPGIRERRGARLGRMLLEKLPFLVVAGFISYWASQAKALTQPGAETGGLPLASRALQSLFGIGFYVTKSVAPIGLSPFYELPADAMTNPATWLGPTTVVGLALVIGAVTFVRRAPAVSAAIVAYIVILLPNLGIVQISQQAAADRYGYLATVPLAALFAGGFFYLMTNRSRATTAASRDDAAEIRLAQLRNVGVALFVAVAALSLISGARRYARDWQTSIKVWNRVLAVDPNSPHGHCNLGAALVAEGDFEGAAHHLNRAIELRSDFSFAYANLGAVLLQLEDWSGAARCYQTALEVIHQMPDEDQAKTHFGLAIALFESGDATGGWKHLHMASELGFPREKIEAAALRY